MTSGVSSDPDCINSESFQGLLRLARAEASMDLRTASVLAHHLALERELIIVLQRLIPHIEPLIDQPFTIKVDMLECVWTFGGSVELARALRRYNDLRNSLAHGHPKAAIDQKQKRLEQAVSKLSGHELDWGIRGSAAYLIGYLNSPADDVIDLAQT